MEPKLIWSVTDSQLQSIKATPKTFQKHKKKKRDRYEDIFKVSSFPLIETIQFSLFSPIRPSDRRDEPSADSPISHFYDF